MKILLIIFQRYRYCRTVIYLILIAIPQIHAEPVSLERFCFNGLYFNRAMMTICLGCVECQSCLLPTNKKWTCNDTESKGVYQCASRTHTYLILSCFDARITDGISSIRVICNPNCRW